jgi:hypothetical protein
VLSGASYRTLVEPRISSVDAEEERVDHDMYALRTCGSHKDYTPDPTSGNSPAQGLREKELSPIHERRLDDDLSYVQH